MKKEIHIPNPDFLNKKIEDFKKDGAEGFHVISDFDRTLTPAKIKGKKFHSCIAILREQGYLTKDYAQQAFDLFDKYHPIEISNKISQEEKNKKMVEWWSTHLNLMIRCGMNKEVIDDIIKKKLVVFREGTLEFLEILYKNKIPLLIFSAGLGDIIEESLSSEGRLYKNIHVISNFFKFDKNGMISDYRHNIVHTFNKSEIQLKNFPYSKNIIKRNNVILIGDSLGDLGMSKGIYHNNIIRIGFLNENIENLFDDYSKNFDVLILNDGSMNYVNNLIKNILNL